MIKHHVKTQLKTKPLPGFTFWAFWTIVSSPRGVCICSAQEQVLADLPPKTEATRNAYFELAKTEFENCFFFGYITRYYQHPSEWIFYSLWYDYLFQVSTVSNAAPLMQRLSGLQIVLWLPLTRWQKVGKKWVVVVVVVVLVLVLVLVLVFVLLLLLLLLLSCSLFFFCFAFPEDSWGETRTISPKLLAQNSLGELCELCILDISLGRSFEVKVRSKNTSLRVYVCQFAMRRLLQGFGNLWHDSDYTSSAKVDQMSYSYSPQFFLLGSRMLSFFWFGKKARRWIFTWLDIAKW